MLFELAASGQRSITSINCSSPSGCYLLLNGVIYIVVAVIEISKPRTTLSRIGDGMLESPIFWIALLVFIRADLGLHPGFRFLGVCKDSSVNKFDR